MIDWEHKYPARDMGNSKVRAVGMGMAMQGSGISGMDVGSATLKLNDDGFYTLMIGAAELIRIPRPMTPAPMRLVPLTLPARPPKSVP